MTSSPVESATARPAGVDTAPVPRVEAAGPTEAVVPRAVPRAGGPARAAGTPVQVRLAGRGIAEGGVTAQRGREGTRHVEGVTAAPGRQEPRKNEAAPG
jgi:hypothetical protein